MKITTSKTVTEQKEIKLPYFSKDEDTFYAILTDEQALKVQFIKFPTLPPTVRLSTSVPAQAIGKEETDAKTFLDVYYMADRYLYDLYKIIKNEEAEKVILDIDGGKDITDYSNQSGGEVIVK